MNDARTCPPKGMVLEEYYYERDDGSTALVRRVADGRGGWRVVTVTVEPNKQPADP